MLMWRTRFVITSNKQQVMTNIILFKRGVFQGDSLSPLLFCISLLPLSVVLREKHSGYMCGKPRNRVYKINHLFYMDDLKLYGSSKESLKILVFAVAEYSRAIGMDFGLDKCAVIHMIKGRRETAEMPSESENIQLIGGNTIHHLGVGETYTYLGIPQSESQDVCGIKDHLHIKYRGLLRKIWSSELSGKNKIQATNTLAIPLLLYTFGAVKWNVNELKDLDRETRRMMTVHRSHHPRSSVQRIYLPRDRGGRGLLNLECLHRRIVLSAACSIMNSRDPLMQFVHQHEIANVGAFLYQAAERAANELSLPFETSDIEHGIASLTPLMIKKRVKEAEHSLLLQEHIGKPVHGQFFSLIKEMGLSVVLSFAFLKSAGLKSETEGFLFACQDGVINTLVYRSRVMHISVDNTNCRACKKYPETLSHILSACPKYACCRYIERHNAALKVLYYHLRHQYGIDKEPILPYAQGDQESVVENDQCKIYWNFSFSTTHRISATKPDIVLQDHKSQIICVIEFSAPAESNIIQKEDEKRTKYQDLLFELSRMYAGYRVRLIVLVLGCLGGMRASFVSQLRKIPSCEHRADALAVRMQKAVLLNSLNLVRQHCSL